MPGTVSLAVRSGLAGGSAALTSARQWKRGALLKEPRVTCALARAGAITSAAKIRLKEVLEVIRINTR